MTRGLTYNDVTSIITKTFKEHNHPPSPANVRLYDAYEKLRHQALQTNASPMAISQQLLASVDPEVAAILPSRSSMERNICRCGGKEGNELR